MRCFIRQVLAVGMTMTGASAAIAQPSTSSLASQSPKRFEVRVGTRASAEQSWTAEGGASQYAGTAGYRWHPQSETGLRLDAWYVRMHSGSRRANGPYVNGRDERTRYAGVLASLDTEHQMGRLFFGASIGGGVLHATERWTGYDDQPSAPHQDYVFRANSVLEGGGSAGVHVGFDPIVVGVIAMKGVGKVTATPLLMTIGIRF